ncbi:MULTISPECIES: inner membrane protein YbjM [Erwinia]|uniref:inner membrane protein YbjM n=1 Tax=Erwinia TaxID=551 RepID=UPI00068E3808|nr:MULTISPECIES: inner membrane protein YbjM [Erwinia]
MMLKGVSRTSVLGSFVLFCLVFLAVGSQMSSENPAKLHARLGLLMFILPGVMTALFCRSSPLVATLLGALLATPVCLIALHTWFTNSGDLVQEVAFVTSAVFWCGSGALLVMLWRMMFWQQHR